MRFNHDGSANFSTNQTINGPKGHVSVTLKMTFTDRGAPVNGIDLAWIEANLDNAV